MAEDLRPRCPKCGEPARQVIAEAKVRCELTNDGLMGRIVGVGATVVETHIYVCGGGHEFTGKETVDVRRDQDS